MSVIEDQGRVIQTWPSCRRAGASRHRFYKHGPPGGGRARLVTASINMALLTEGRTPH
jgi:hypothetical protein